MSAAAGIDPVDEAELEAVVELVPLAHGLRAVLVVGYVAKAETLRRIERRGAEREAEAKAKARRVKREALARSNPGPGRRGGAA